MTLHLEIPKSVPPSNDAHPGLEGVILGPTRLSDIDGQNGHLRYCGYSIEDLAGVVSPESVAWLLATGELPSGDEEETLTDDLDSRRQLPPSTLRLLREAAGAGVEPMAALRLAVDSLAWVSEPPTALPGWDPIALGVLARLPVIVAAYERLRRGEEPLPPLASGGAAIQLLHGLDGRLPSAARAAALERYLVTVADHGSNASTFAMRVVLSTGAGWLEGFCAALGALSGPLHGGAPGPALALVREIGRADRAEAVIAAKLAAGERLMGFGHRVYKARDPRAEVLARAAETLLEEEGDTSLVGLVRSIETTAERLLEAHKPGRRLRANVELYTALLLESLGLPPDLFTAVFAVGRVAGWLAHGREQRAEGRLIRPLLRYSGAAPRSVSR